MKTKILLIGLLISVAFAHCKRYKYPVTSDLPPTVSSEVIEGQKLYMHYCQKCHPDGEAGLGPSIYYLPSFMKKFQARHGLGAMPKFSKEVISREELNNITAYLKYLDKSY